MPKARQTILQPPQSPRHGRRALARGFTLIELMLGVAILGILIAIAVPAYQSYQDRVRMFKAVADIKSIEALVLTYKAEERSLPANLGQVGAAGMRDPWGNPYQYMNLEDINGNGKARKNKNLVPINSDFDLWSNGKDGASQSPLTAQVSRDDIVRANDGRFVGLASEYDP
jgi:general secretion pathway protein G